MVLKSNLRKISIEHPGTSRFNRYPLAPYVRRLGYSEREGKLVNFYTMLLVKDRRQGDAPSVNGPTELPRLCPVFLSPSSPNRRIPRVKVKRQFHPIYSTVFHNLKAKMSTSSRTDRLPRERKEMIIVNLFIFPTQWVS